MDQSKDPQYIQLLARKLQENTITDAERSVFESWYNGFENVVEITSGESRKEMQERIYGQILQQQDRQPRRRALYRYLAAAASLLLALSFGAYFLFDNSKPNANMQAGASVIVPGGNKAVLTLANGRQILLAEAGTGQLAIQGNTVVSKGADGRLSYAATGDGTAPADAVNTVKTPFGGQYQLVLADGTKVWLNAGSSITYPTSFARAERQVEMTGEVYFEVSHHTNWPFKVISRGQAVEVLGTHFNVNAYDNEDQSRTTLLQGSVRVRTGQASTLLKPGLQAIVDSEGLRVDKADLEEAIAWKQGYFRFNDERIGSVMRKLARWYNVEVKFEGKVTEESFSGKISRTKSIYQTLDMLQHTGAIHFKVEGRRVIVMQ